jgi:hypothetical protein
MIRYLFLVLLTAGPASAQTAIAPIPQKSKIRPGG